LRRVGTPLLGAVVLPRLKGVRAGAAPQPAVALAPPTVMSQLPGPDETAVLAALDNDQTQPMRIPTNTVSRPVPRTATRSDSDAESTAVIRMARQEGKGSADGKSDRR
jgi:hypothetical protein